MPEGGWPKKKTWKERHAEVQAEKGRQARAEAEAYGGATVVDAEPLSKAQMLELSQRFNAVMVDDPDLDPRLWHRCSSAAANSRRGEES